VGGRLGFISGEATSTVSAPSVAVARSGSVDWVAPLVGVRLRHQFTPAQEAFVRGDVGGFGLESQFEWQAVAELRLAVPRLSAGCQSTLTSSYLVPYFFVKVKLQVRPTRREPVPLVPENLASTVK
jgi:hypothetical protein